MRTTRSLFRSIASKSYLSHHHLNLFATVQQQLSTATPTTQHHILAISKNVPYPLVQRLTSILSDSNHNWIGLLTEPLPSTANDPRPIYSIALTSSTPSSSSIDSNTTVIPFRSTLTGRENIAVGKEINSKSTRYNDSTVDQTVDNGFGAFLNGRKDWNFGQAAVQAASASNALPGFTELAGIEPQRVQQIVCFTADRSQPFLAALSTYSSATTIGLNASSTPFHSPSGLPFTLFHSNFNGEVLVSGTGSVGIAVVNNETSGGVAANVRIDYHGLEIFDKALEITSAKGNIVLTLSTQNAARLLLKAVQDLNTTIVAAETERGVVREARNDRGEEKEKEFWAAVFERDPGPTPDLAQSIHVSRIMAGDPSRGAMSFDTEEEMKVGYWVVFLHRPTASINPTASPLVPTFFPYSTSSTSAVTTTTTSPSSFIFLALPASDDIPSDVDHSQALENEIDPVIVLDGFIAGSENGIVMVKQEGRRGWICRTEGTVLRRD